MTSFSVPKGPQRIVCLTEEPTEILYKLGAADKIVGISAHTERPAEAKRDKPVVSAFVGGSLPKIQALKPDLIIGFSDVQAELAAKLIKAGLPVLIFNQRSLQEILEVILTIGRIVGKTAEAEQLVSAYARRLEATQAQSQKLPYRPKVYFEEWNAPMISAIRWVSELIEVAGGEDVFAHLSHGRASRERYVSEDDIAAAQPDLMLAAWCGKPFDAIEATERLGHRGIPAVDNRRMIEVPSSIILQPGPACLTDGLDFLEHVIAETANQLMQSSINTSLPLG